VWGILPGRSRATGIIPQQERTGATAAAGVCGTRRAAGNLCAFKSHGRRADERRGRELVLLVTDNKAGIAIDGRARKIELPKIFVILADKGFNWPRGGVPKGAIAAIEELR